MTEDIETIINQLRQMQNGANVHTINKAVSYLRALSEPVWFIKDETERIERFERHCIKCRAAIRSKTTTALARAMRRWF